ncbi:extracellular solute-binding protein [Rhizobium sp. BE258]|jgi:raffinose/stachyose/melibiose transport system substrate-binding protein|uniref:ABC transporter substrate-binding protein n=1 Tax=Rhizobium sp. BE258 TaxID=2817722 RepID=UPI000DD6B781|nr:extracellular solute-binding protein [Rhizobium sp. BE258]MDR7141963.1 raffinose/stachyose/melibiose transport system substrate-binding protein [Rhizobium sp. BE258]
MTRLKLFAATALIASTSHIAIAQEKVSWWYEQATPDQQKLIQKDIVEPFAKANPDYSLVIDYRGNELDKQLRVAMLSGNGPDVVYTAGPSYVAPMAQSGQLMPLDDYAAKYKWQDRILPVFLKMGEYNGKIYALPKTYETVGLFYNKTLFAQKNWQAPKTLDELETVADAMLKDGITPFAAGNADWRGANEWFVTLALNSVAGPENLNKALRGEMPWTAEPFVKSIDRLNSWWQKGYFGKNYFSVTSSEQAADAMASGKAGMMPTGTWQFQNVDTYGKKAGSEAGFVGFPSASGDPVFPLGIGSTFSIATKAKNPDGAAAAINYVFSPEVYETMNSAWQGEWNIPLKDISNVKMASEVTPLFTETMKNLSSSVNDGKYGYTTWTFLPPATDSYVINGIEEVWLKKTTTADFLAKMDASFQKEMKAGKAPAVPAR